VQRDEREDAAHWACCCGRPVFGFRGLFTEVSFTQAVEAARQLMDDMELELALFSGPVSIRDLWPGSFSYRLRHAALSASRVRPAGENRGGECPVPLAPAGGPSSGVGGWL
jgi:hypothetical protein